MLKLHGARISNHYNKVKVALLEKGAPFEEVQTMFSQEPEFLKRSAVGKIPYIDVNGQFLCETQAINEYIEEAHPTPALLPKDPWQRAKVRELIQVMESYVLYPSFRLLGHVFFGAPLGEETKADVKATLDRGVPALARLAKFDPYIAGSALTLADCAAFFHLPLVGSLTKAVYGKDALADLPVAAYLERMLQRPSFAKAENDRNAAMQAFMASRSK